MILRPASIDDSYDIACVHTESWQAAYRGIVPQAYLDQLSVADRQNRWIEVFEKGGSEVLVAEVPEGVIGCISYGKSRDKDLDAGIGEIYALYVASAHWSTGVGRTLWVSSRTDLITCGFSRASIWVLLANVRAIQFYERAGFGLCNGSETMVSIGGEELPEVRYESAIA